MIKKIEIKNEALKPACDAIDKIGKEFHEKIERMNQCMSESMKPLEWLKAGNIDKHLKRTLKATERNTFMPKD